MSHFTYFPVEKLPFCIYLYTSKCRKLNTITNSGHNSFPQKRVGDGSICLIFPLATLLQIFFSKNEVREGLEVDHTKYKLWVSRFFVNKIYPLGFDNNETSD